MIHNGARDLTFPVQTSEGLHPGKWQFAKVHKTLEAPAFPDGSDAQSLAWQEAILTNLASCPLPDKKVSLFLERPRFSVPWFPFPEKLRAQKFEKTLVFAAKLLLAPAYAAKRKAFASVLDAQGAYGVDAVASFRRLMLKLQMSV